jgi:hypothetical protein
MKKLSVLGIIGGAALLTAAPFSLQWTQKNVALSLDSAEARIGRPGTALNGAGAAAAVGYGFGGYYGGYGGYGYPAYSYSAPYATSYGTGYGYGSYYGGYGYPGYSSAPYNPGPSFGFGWRY